MAPIVTGKTRGASIILAMTVVAISTVSFVHAAPTINDRSARSAARPASYYRTLATRVSECAALQESLQTHQEDACAVAEFCATDGPLLQAELMNVLSGGLSNDGFANSAYYDATNEGFSANDGFDFGANEAYIGEAGDSLSDAFFGAEEESTIDDFFANVVLVEDGTTMHQLWATVYDTVTGEGVPGPSQFEFLYTVAHVCNQLLGPCRVPLSGEGGPLSVCPAMAATGTSTATSGSAAVDESCPETWLGDNECDAACNSADFGYDGGDCALDQLAEFMAPAPPTDELVPTDDSLTEVASDVGGVLQTVGETVVDSFGDVVDASEDFADSVASGDVVDATSSLFDSAEAWADVASDAIDAGAEGLGDITDAALSGLGVPDDVAEPVGDIIGTVADVAGDVVEGVVDVAGAVAGAVGDGIEALGNFFGSIFG